MDPYNEVKVIRAPSLKRGKNDERLSDRVSLKIINFIDFFCSTNLSLKVEVNKALLFVIEIFILTNKI
jgi:hypothetical protein